MEKYFLGICIVIASLIYVWGNQWVVLSGFEKDIYATKYNRITGETKIAVLYSDSNMIKFIPIPDLETKKQND